MRTLSILSIVALAAVASADEQKDVIIDTEVIAKRGPYPIAVATTSDSEAKTAQTVTEVLTFDLEVSSWFRVADPKSHPKEAAKEGMGIDPEKWKDISYGVIKASSASSGGKVALKFKLYEIDKGATAVLEREYNGDANDVRGFVHKWANEVVLYYTGEEGFFGSRIVLSGDGRKGSKIWTMDFDGNGLGAITKNGSINILPAWAPGGGQIAFTSYMRGAPHLYLVKPGGRPKKIASFDGMNTGAAWSRDGSRLAVTLSQDGNAEIYLLNIDGSVNKRLTNNRYIDTSPAWSPDGSEIAFVSNREGTPQIYVMKSDGTGAKRVTTKGTYNQTPTFCPKSGTRLLAYTTRDDATGEYEIMTLDLSTGTVTRVTQGKGTNEEPAWSPNCRVLAFASHRTKGTGIYLANADGTGDARLVARGNFTSPDWGPAP